ncbi:auxin response factor 2A-like isoform X2 [Camellia sinensis]|uniref:auxin response factor 2A-like isoform X2 n=1 Tax=Camellia sinensis TaxID=4442 RepID=UPI0010357786|nr:auxin response factor 2A-like isoform X2 [Camellia sinensis]
MDSSSGNERFSHKVVEVETENNRCNQGQKDDLHAQLWHACAGPLVNVPRAGDKVFYFPQGHIEQVEAYSNQDGKVEMPIYDLPSKILCKVVYVQLKAEPYTDEVFAQITLLPEGPSPEHRTSQCQHQKINACSFRKRLTPSDQSTHGGFSVPKRYADECFPPLDMSQEPPTQELVAKDLHGSEWRFRHIYRGHPKRHLLSSGWSTFVSAKKLVVGDACIFLRGENGELYVGVRRATKSQISIPASVISGVSMQHGILASAFHAVSTGTMFTVYYRPWTSPAEFIIPYDRYMKSAENDYSIGTRFSMQFDGEECPEPKCSIFAGTVVGINNIDCIRWPGSEWRCLKVQWDAPSKKIVRPQRISHWNIEPEEVKKKCSSILTDRKRERPLDPSTPGFTVLVSEGLSKGSVEHPPKRQLEVLQGQENRAIDAHEFGALRQPLLSHLIPQPNPDWGHPQIGLENQPHFLIGDAHEFGALRQPLLSHLIPQPNPDWGHPQIGLENQPHFLIGDAHEFGALRQPLLSHLIPQLNPDCGHPQIGLENQPHFLIGDAHEFGALRQPLLSHLIPQLNPDCGHPQIGLENQPHFLIGDAHEFGALRQPLLSHLIPQLNPDCGHPQIGLENQPHFLIGDAHEFGALRQPLLSHLIPQLNPDCGHPQIGLENQPHFLIGDAHEFGALRQPLLSHLIPQLNPDCGHPQIGLENQPHFLIGDAHEFGALRQPLLSHLIPQLNPDCGHPQIGLENQPHFLIGDAHEFGALRQPLLSHLIPQLNPDCGHPQIGLENQPHFLIGESADYWSPTFTSSGAHDSVEVSRSLSFPKFNSTSSVSVDCKAPEEYKIKAPLSQPNGNAKCMLFGVNIFSSPLELPSQQVVSCSDLHSVCPALPVVSHSSISETDQVSETSKSVYGNLSEKQCKNCCSITGRSCTKVLKYGTVLGRSVHLARFDDYDELIRELDQMFDFKGSLIDGSNGWHVTYTDGKGNMMLIGDYPWLNSGSWCRRCSFVQRKMLISWIQLHQTQHHYNSYLLGLLPSLCLIPKEVCIHSRTSNTAYSESM